MRMHPRRFLCAAEMLIYMSFKFQLMTLQTLSIIIIFECWDFGANPRGFYSYAYQYPFTIVGFPGNFPVTPLSDSGIAIMADKSPYLVSTVDASTKLFSLKNSPPSVLPSSEDEERAGNSDNHKKEGQNVLYNDGHVSFADASNVGFDSDNIYTMVADPMTGASLPITDRVRQLGYILPQSVVRQFNVLLTNAVVDEQKIYPRTKTDSLLINEGSNQGMVNPVK